MEIRTCPRCGSSMKMRSYDDSGDVSFWLECSAELCFISYGVLCDGCIDGVEYGAFDSGEKLVDSWHNEYRWNN